VEERTKRLNQLPPEERQRLEERYRQFQSLPPARQQAIRQSLREFRDLPGARKHAIRQEHRRQQAMSDEERAARVDSPEFRGQFNERERQMLEGLQALPPPRP
jgi:hypothetical protein